MVWTKEQQRIYNMTYRKKHKEEIKAKKKIIYEKNKEKLNAISREYYQKNKEQKRISGIEYYEKNKEKISAKKKIIYQKNKEELKAKSRAIYHKNRDRDKEKDNAKHRAYSRTAGGIRLGRLCNWRKRGVIFASKEEESAFYLLFINTHNCELCGMKFDDNYRNQKRCLDHCHISGLVRNIVCRSCNSSLPRQVVDYNLKD